MFRIYATKDIQFVQVERDNVLDAFRAVRRFRKLGWKVRVSR